MRWLAYCACVVALLTGPALAGNGYSQSPGVSNYDSQPNGFSPGDNEDQSVIDPDGGEDDADSGDEDDSQDGSVVPDTYPA